jgi:NAD(P)-dependent dehydrogenase (short-subunit alcohol dehydrogenase family)
MPDRAALSSTSICAPSSSSTASARTCCGPRAPSTANALVVNLSSITGKTGQAWLSVYSATKAAVVGWTQAMNKELNGEGIKSVALCPGFVDTPMTELIREQVKPEKHDQDPRHRGGGALPARPLPRLRGAGDRLPALRRGNLNL